MVKDGADARSCALRKSAPSNRNASATGTRATVCPPETTRPEVQTFCRRSDIEIPYVLSRVSDFTRKPAWPMLDAKPNEPNGNKERRAQYGLSYLFNLGFQFILARHTTSPARLVIRWR